MTTPVFPQPLTLLFFASLIGMIATLIFVFATSHRTESFGDSVWEPRMKAAGLDPREFSHDADSWYWKGKFTCVGYGDWDESCDKSKFFCSDRTSVLNTRNGTPDQQIASLKEAIQSGSHPECPLL